MTNFIYSQSFCQKICWEKIAEKIIYFFIFSFWCLTWDTNTGFTYNKPTHYLLDYVVFIMNRHRLEHVYLSTVTSAVPGGRIDPLYVQPGIRTRALRLIRQHTTHSTTAICILMESNKRSKHIKKFFSFVIWRNLLIPLTNTKKQRN